MFDQELQNQGIEWSAGCRQGGQCSQPERRWHLGIVRQLTESFDEFRIGSCCTEQPGNFDRLFQRGPVGRVQLFQQRRVPACRHLLELALYHRIEQRVPDNQRGIAVGE